MIIDRLHANWGAAKYLAIGEVSMVSRKTLASVSTMIGVGKQVEGDNNGTVAFGGINLILSGDFYQFPPVIGVGKGRGALYAPASEAHGVKEALDQQLYKRFMTVVLLAQQFRNQDPV